MVAAGTIVDDFTSLTGFTATGCTPTVNTDMTYVKNGTTSIKIVPDGVTANVNIYKTISMNLSGGKSVSLWVYIVDATKVSDIGLYLYTGGTYKDYQWNANLVSGWNHLKIPKGLMYHTGDFGATFTQMTVRMMLVAGANPTNCYFDRVTVGMECIPKVLLSFDDGRAAFYSIVFPLLQARNMRCTVFIVQTLVGASGYMSLAQLQEMEATGLVDVANHTWSHGDLSTLSYADQYTEINNMRNYLMVNGFNRGKNVLAYPLGGYNANTLTACADIGIQVARTTHNNQQGQPAENTLTFNTIGFSSSSSLTTIMAQIALAINQGDCLSLNGHNIVASGASGSDVTTAVLTTVLDYLIQRKVEVVTFAEWYNGLSNPRKSVSR